MTRKMKDSGIEWIGEIPEEWELSKLKYGFDFQKGINSNTYTKEYIEKNKGEYPVYSGQTENNGVMGKINTYDYDIEECLFTTTVGAKVMDVRLLCGKFNLSQNCLIMISNGLFSINYIFYFLQSLFDFERFMIPQYMQPSLRISDLENYTITTPNFMKQKQISYFLDKKTEQIEEIKNKISKEIENLENYKKSMITEAVTKGLDKNVEMKDSGIEWIGEIPKHWKVIRIKNAAILKARIGWQGLKSDEFLDDSNLPYLVTGTDFKDGLVDWYSCVRISEKRFEMDKNIQINENDLLITKDGTIGKLAIARNCPYKASLNSGVFVIRNKGTYEYNDKYMYYLLKSEQFYLWFELNDAGNSTIRHLYQRDFYNFSFTYPETKEQNQIVDYLDKKTKLIDDSIAIKQKQLETLEEYKKSLIYEYVTGKKEVKDGEET